MSSSRSGLILTARPSRLAAIAANAGARSSSYFSTGSTAYVSKDKHTMFAEIYRPGTPGFSSVTGEKETRAALVKAAPAGATEGPGFPEASATQPSRQFQ